MRHTNIISTIAMTSALAIGSISMMSAAAADRDIKLSGCLVRGEDGGGYLLTNAPGESVWDRERNVPVENLLTPDYMRRVLWTPPKVADAELDEAVAAELRLLSAREWQIELIAPIIAEAIRNPGTVTVISAPEIEPD